MFLALLINKIKNMNKQMPADKKLAGLQEQAILDYLFEPKEEFSDFNFRQPMRRTLTDKKSGGYTLLEVMIAIVFFGVVVLGLGLPVTESLNLSSEDQNIVSANNLARVYLKDVELSWLKQSDYDGGEILQISDKYTKNGYFDVNVNTDNIAFNDDGNVLVRRVNIKYTNDSGTCLADIFLDYNRPGSSLE
jgi:type II secretory pathway pseudopilin PulG